MKLILSWTDLKTSINRTNAALIWFEKDNTYIIYSNNGFIITETTIPKESPASSDQTDFETNYKDDSNSTLTNSHQTLLTAIDEASSTITYIGNANPGSLTSQAVWKIKKIVTSGSVTIIYWADGNSDFDNIWDNRASLTYL